MVIIFQILFSIFSLYALAAVYGQYRAHNLSRTGAIFWWLFWLVSWGVVISPNSTQRVATHLGIGRGTDLVVYVAIALIFYLLFKLHVKVERLSRTVTTVVRQEALDNIRDSL